MAFYRKHPYERENAERGREDTVKTFKNHKKALSIFSLIITLMIFSNLLIVIFCFRDTDLSSYLAGLLCIAASIIVQPKLFKILSKLFKDPRAAEYLVTYLVAGPFIVGVILFTNTLYTFPSPEEKIEIVDYHIEKYYTGKMNRERSRCILELEENKFKFQKGFRTVGYYPGHKYMVYKFRRGILGFRILESWTFSN